MPFTLAMMLFLAAAMFSSYIIGRQNGIDSVQPIQPKTKKSKKKSPRIMDKRAAEAQAMHRGQLIKWAIKAFPGRKITPLRNMRKKDLVKLYVKGAK